MKLVSGKTIITGTIKDKKKYYKQQYSIRETKRCKLRQTQQEQKLSLKILPIDKM